jgi:YjbE family integral membrane protein
VGFLIDDIMHAPFWIAALQIIGVNVILSGDNAVVIALACLTLPPRQRLWGMILGAGVAVLLRILFTLVVAQAMTYPYLKLVGGVLLLWVAIKLVTGDSEGEGNVESADNLWRAVRIVAIADIVMSLDNVLAIAASADVAAARVDAAHAAAIKTTLIIFGLATSIPLIIAGSAILMALLDRYRVLVWAGAALLGWVAGDIMSTDPAVVGRLGEAGAHSLHAWAGRAGGVLVVGIGLALVRRHRAFQPDEVMAAIGLLIWVVGDILIDASFTEADGASRWLARGVVAIALAAGYVLSRRRHQVGTGEA